MPGRFLGTRLASPTAHTTLHSLVLAMSRFRGLPSGRLWKERFDRLVFLKGRGGRGGNKRKCNFLGSVVSEPGRRAITGTPGHLHPLLRPRQRVLTAALCFALLPAHRRCASWIHPVGRGGWWLAGGDGRHQKMAVSNIWPRIWPQTCHTYLKIRPVSFESVSRPLSPVTSKLVQPFYSLPLTGCSG